ncbi:hypothetical protein AGMMS49965_14650 [Bacteroidia bacterium]|nr:hypothetical protein AGMMS49965_14650 [Bacteroidia bacterium]
MKKMMILAATAAFAGTMMTGCGSSKQFDPRGTAIIEDKCEAMANAETNGLRATAQATSGDQQFAKDQAVALARNELAGSMRAGLLSALNVYNDEMRTSDVEGELLRSAGQDVSQFVSEVVRGSKVICSSPYHKQVKNPKTKKEKGVYTVVVCVELSDQSQTLYDKLRSKVNLSQQQFRDKMKEGANAYQKKIDEEDKQQ